MIRVTIKTYHPVYGKHEIMTQISHGQTIRDLLRHMLQAHPKIAATCVNAECLYVSEEYVLLINDRVFEVEGGYDYVLKEGDILTFFAAFKDG